KTGEEWKKIVDAERAEIAKTNRLYREAAMQEKTIVDYAPRGGQWEDTVITPVERTPSQFEDTVIIPPQEAAERAQIAETNRLYREAKAQEKTIVDHAPKGGHVEDTVITPAERRPDFGVEPEINPRHETPEQIRDRVMKQAEDLWAEFEAKL